MTAETTRQGKALAVYSFKDISCAVPTFLLAH